MDKASPGYELHTRRLAKARSGEEATCGSATEDRISILFSDASAEGRTSSLPLVVYIAGSGEQGTDLKLMFRQTAVFSTVRDPKFQAAHPCHLLAIMLPRFANHSAHYGYPTGGQPDLQELYADLIFDLNRDLTAKGRQPIRIDRTALVGLGSGGTAAAALALDYPDRYAGVCAMLNAPLVDTTDDIHPGRWWYGTPADWKIEPDNEAARNYREAGADFRQTFYTDTKKANWWDGPFSSDEFRAWLAVCFKKGPVKSGRTEHVMRPPKARIADWAKCDPLPVPVLVKTGADEAIYCGTEERFTRIPEGERIRDLEGITYLRINTGVRKIPARLFENSPDLRTVVLGRDVKSIGTRAFANSRNLSLIYLSDCSQTLKLAADAFTDCSADLSIMQCGSPVGCTPFVTDGLLIWKHQISIPSETSSRFYLSGDYVWETCGDAVNPLMYLGKEKTIVVPELLDGRRVTRKDQFPMGR